MADGQANPQQPLATLPPDVAALTRAFPATTFAPGPSQAQMDENSVMQRVSAIPDKQQQIIQGTGLGLSPMISKENDDAQLVPPSQVTAAQQAGYRHATLMRNTQGQLHLVGNDQVQDAVNNDWTVSKATPSPAPYVPKPKPPEMQPMMGLTSGPEAPAAAQLLNPGEIIRTLGNKYALPWLQKNAQQNLAEEQRELNLAVGPESEKTSLPAQAGYTLLAPVHRAAALTSSVVGAALTDRNAQAAMAAGVVDPAIPLAYFGAQGFQGATGIGTGEKGSVRQAWENPTPENWSKALTDLAMVFGSAEGAAPGTIVHPSEVGMRAPLTPEAAGAAPGIGEAPVDTGYGASLGLFGRGVSKAVSPATGMLRRAWDPEELTATQAATKAFRPRNAKAQWQQEIAQSLPLMRRSADQMGINVDNMTPDEALQTADDAAGQAWAEYKRNHLGPNADVMIATQPVADAMRATIDNHMREQNPGLAAEIERVAQTFDNRQMPLGEVQSRVSTLNNETRNIEAKYPRDRAAAKIAQQNEYVFAQRDTLRGLMDEKLNSLTGPGAAELRQNYGALRSVQDVIQRRLNVVDRASREPLAAILAKAYAAGHIATAILSGHPLGALGGLLTVAAERRAEALSNPNYLTQQAFKKTKPAPPWLPTTPEGPRAPTMAEQVGARAQQLAGAQQQGLPFGEGPLFGIQQTPAPEPAGPPYRMPASSEPAPPEQGQLPPAPQQGRLAAAPEQRQLPARGTEPAVPPRTGPFAMPPSVIGPQRPALQPAGLPERQISPTPGFEAPMAPSPSAEQDFLQKATAQGRGPFAKQGPSEGGPSLEARVQPATTTHDALTAALNMNPTIEEGGPNEAARIHLDDAAKALLGQAIGTQWTGKSLQLERGQQISRQLNAWADQVDKVPTSNPNQAAQKTQIVQNTRNLANMLDRVATLNSDPSAGHAGVPLIHDVSSIGHEATVHGGQRALAGGSGDIRNFTDHTATLTDPNDPTGAAVHPAVEKATPILQSWGYDVSHPAVISAEMQAHILDGNYEKFGLTKEEAIDWMEHSLNVLEQFHGPDKMGENIPRLAQGYVKAIKDFVGEKGEGATAGEPTAAESTTAGPGERAAVAATQPAGAGGGYDQNAPTGENAQGASPGGIRTPDTGPAAEVGPSLEARRRDDQAAEDNLPPAQTVPYRPGDEHIVSTRKPTGKNPTFDHTTDTTKSIGVKEIVASGRAPEMVDAIRNYPGMKGLLKGITDPQQALQKFVNFAADNIVAVYKAIDKPIRDMSRRWYPSANGYAQNLVDTHADHGITLPQAAAVIAVHSPNTEWNINASQASRVTDIWLNHQKTPYTERMAEVAPDITAASVQPYLKAIEGKSLGELTNPLEQAMWVRLYDEAENPTEYPLLRPDGTTADVARKKPTAKQAKQGLPGDPKKLAWSGLDHIAKGISILQDGSLANISQELGDKHKVRNFYNNIVNPDGLHGHLTVDTHAVGAALFKPVSQDDIEVSHNFGGGQKASEPGELPVRKAIPSAGSNTNMGVSGTYGLYADAYRQAAQRLEELPQYLQSITWDGIRTLFPQTFKNVQANKDIINNVWREVDRNKKTPAEARREIINATAKIKGTTAKGAWGKPDWVGDTGLHEGEGNAANPQTVAGSQLPGQRSAPAVSGRGSRNPGGSARQVAPIPPQLKRVIRK